jgi:hypothetical protein
MVVGGFLSPPDGKNSGQPTTTRSMARKLRDRICRRKTKITRKSNAKRVIVEHVFAHIQSMRRLSFCYEQRQGNFRQFSLMTFGHRIGQALSRMQ